MQTALKLYPADMAQWIILHLIPLLLLDYHSLVSINPEIPLIWPPSILGKMCHFSCIQLYMIVCFCLPEPGQGSAIQLEMSGGWAADLNSRLLYTHLNCSQLSCWLPSNKVQSLMGLSTHDPRHYWNRTLQLMILGAPVSNECDVLHFGVIGTLL